MNPVDVLDFLNQLQQNYSYYQHCSRFYFSCFHFNEQNITIFEFLSQNKGEIRMFKHFCNLAISQINVCSPGKVNFFVCIQLVKISSVLQDFEEDRPRVKVAKVSLAGQSWFKILISSHKKKNLIKELESLNTIQAKYKDNNYEECSVCLNKPYYPPEQCFGFISSIKMKQCLLISWFNFGPQWMIMGV